MFEDEAPPEELAIAIDNHSEPPREQEIMKPRALKKPKAEKSPGVENVIA